ncbi:MAG: tetratricopeptide repeat protein [Acidobacteria bacterium]|nr:tetratricopeptide repeat protein [Acidobacteriota bacterium]
MHWLVVGFVALLLNSAYLFTFADPTLWYFLQVALHPLLGLTLGAGVAWSILAWRFRPGALALAGLATSGLGLAFGVAVSILGATTAYRLLVEAHVATSALGATLLVVYLWATAPRLGRAWAVRAATATVLVAAAAAAIQHGSRQARWRSAYRIVNPPTPPATMEEEGAGPTSPFFPSSANTNVNGIIPATFFMTSQSCGRCHRDIYEQWSSSAHHFSSFNNQWYRKSVEYMQDVTGTRPSKWCAGCHDHAVFFNGRFDRPIREQVDTPEAQAGLACTSCHSITRVHSSMGQGDFEIEYPPMHDLAASENPLLRRVHDALLYLAPEPHRRTFLKPFHREQTAEFCSACHKVHLDVPVNRYRWFRGFNDYDNWQASGVSGQGARSFYYPAQPQKCADCHMPLVDSTDPAAKNGKIRSHRFPAANTALPFVNHDPVQLKVVQDFLRDGQISVDLFGITRVTAGPTAGGARAATEGIPQIASTFAVGEESAAFGAAAATLAAPPAEVLAPLDRIPVTVRRGESVRVEVVVRTRKVGHFFPGGTVDAFDVWVELEAVDDKGRVLLHSGQVADNGKGPVDPAAHFYRSLQLDEHGNPINKRNAWMTRSVAYVRLIPPGAADTVHYHLQIPRDAGNTIFLRAKVNYRKFAWWNTQWAFAGVRDPSQPHPPVTPSYDDGRWRFTGDTSGVSGAMKAIPDIPTTVMAEATASMAVTDERAAFPTIKPFLDASVRERWNDYGIGLLLQGDLKGAQAAFRNVMAMDPAYADGPVNVARAQLQEGDVDGAMEALEQALKISPRLAKAHFFLGTALKTLGRYDAALDHLRVAAEQYPRDRVVLNQIGRVQFLERRFDEAIASFTKALAVDPEDLEAHYNLMLCYQGKGDAALAGRERSLYTRFKADEAAQAITGPYRLKAPEDNNERQSIHEHR